jgi:hypothetical protein
MQPDSLKIVPTPRVRRVARGFQVFIQRLAALVRHGRFFFPPPFFLQPFSACAELRKVILGEKLRVEVIFR